MIFNLNKLRDAAIAAGNDIAEDRNLDFDDLFADSLEGELARLRVRQVLRRHNPEASGELLERVVEEACRP